MGEVKRYDMLIDYGCSKFDSPEIDPHEIKDGYWVKHSDYATLEAERDALRAEVAKLREQMDADLATYTETMEEATATMARAEAELVASSAEVAKLRAAQANMIDATGAVETGVFWYSGRYVVEIPKSMALSRVLIVRVAK